MQKSVLVAADRIRRLEVQGARNVAITSIKAIEEGSKVSKAKGKEDFLRELFEAKEILFASDCDSFEEIKSQILDCSHELPWLNKEKVEKILKQQHAKKENHSKLLMMLLVFIFWKKKYINR